MTILTTVPVLQGARVELVGKNEQIAQDQFSEPVAVPMNEQQHGGIIQSITLFQTVEGSGALLDADGVVLIFPSNPANSAGDTDLAAAAWKTCLGAAPVASTDWVKGAANGEVAFLKDVNIPFPFAQNLYLVFQLISATAINSAAGDDEVLEAQISYLNLG